MIFVCFLFLLFLLGLSILGAIIELIATIPFMVFVIVDCLIIFKILERRRH